MTATPQSIGRYVVRERLGEGGMGVLYLALDPAIDRLVAVKLLGVQGPELRERFVREAGLAGRLQHPNIVTVYDVGAHEGQPFIAMEYIPGETLGELIHRRATLSLRRRLELIVEACQGLAFAHRHGIVHRDVKPANLMVSRESGALKVLDFGIARGMDSSLTQAGMVMGTPNYMSPEQLEGRPLDHRSDIFAVGLVLYEVLGYRQAFSGDTPQAVWHQIISAQPPSILDLNPNLDDGLAPIIDRAIAKRVEDRYPDLDALRADLIRLIHKLQSMQSGDTLVDALPITPSSQSRRPDFARLAERRAAQIVVHLRNAEDALVRQDLDAAQEAAEEAALLDTHDPRVLTLLERIRQALDAREMSGMVADAQEAIRAGSLTSAAGLISRVLQMMPTNAEALALRVTLQQALETREREQGRARVIGNALAQAESQLAAGALESALRTTSEALGYDPAHAGALELKARVQEAVRLHIDDVLAEARADAAGKRYTAALHRLELARPRDERIAALENELREAWSAARETPHPPVSDRLETPPPMPAAPTPEPMAVKAPTPAEAVTAWAPPTPPRAITPAAAVPSAAPPQLPVATPPVSTPAASQSASTPPRLAASRSTRAAASARPEQRRAQAQDYLDRARTQLAVGDFARSLSLVDAALVLDPSRADANDLRRHIDQAWAANELGRPSRSRGAGV